MSIILRISNWTMAVLISSMVTRAANVGQHLVLVINRNTLFKGESLKPVPGLKLNSTIKHIKLFCVSPVML